MVGRRLLILVAVLMGVTALAAGLAATPRRHRPAPPPPVAPVPQAAGAEIQRTIDAAEPRTVAVNAGDLVRLTVRGDELDVVELTGLDRLEPIAPDTPAVFDVLADAPGTYALRLMDAGRVVGRLRVTRARE